MCFERTPFIRLRYSTLEFNAGQCLQHVVRAGIELGISGFISSALNHSATPPSTNYTLYLDAVFSKLVIVFNFGVLHDHWHDPLQMLTNSVTCLAAVQTKQRTIRELMTAILLTEQFYFRNLT